MDPGPCLVVEDSPNRRARRPRGGHDEAAIDALFGTGWKRLSLEHGISYKYERPKALWEVVLERSE